MELDIDAASAAQGSAPPARWLRACRRLALPAALALTLGLTACGGGEATFTVDVTVGGVLVGGGPVSSGQRQSISLLAGESIALDASEPVEWTLYVGGSAVTGGRTAVSYAGADITVTAVSSSRIVVDTYARYLLPAPVVVTFVARSTFDSALVATIDVAIDN